MKDEFFTSTNGLLISRASLLQFSALRWDISRGKEKKKEEETGERKALYREKNGAEDTRESGKKGGRNEEEIGQRITHPLFCVRNPSSGGVKEAKSTWRHV